MPVDWGRQKIVLNVSLSQPPPICLALRWVIFPDSFRTPQYLDWLLLVFCPGFLYWFVRHAWLWNLGFCFLWWLASDLGHHQIRLQVQIPLWWPSGVDWVIFHKSTVVVARSWFLVPYDLLIQEEACLSLIPLKHQLGLIRFVTAESCVHHSCQPADWALSHWSEFLRQVFWLPSAHIEVGLSHLGTLLDWDLN